MYILRGTRSYENSFHKLVSDNESLKKRVMVALQKLSLHPAHPSLNSHKVNTPDHGIRWSSRVTGDMRIIWDYDKEERLVILLLDIGSHSGGHKVYK